jgi:AcrR family transcriptional regulator
MSRPSRNQDQLLIETAKRLYPRMGASGMSLKMVADKAGVNLGMFSYYFKTKSNFIRKVLESLAADARKEVEIEVPETATSIEQLRYFLIVMGHTFHDQRKLALAMYRDLLNQDPDVTAFLTANMERQMQFLGPLIEKCQEDGYIDSGLTVRQAADFCMASVKTPIVISAALEQRAGGRPKSAPNKEQSKSEPDQRITLGVDLALRGIASRRR